MDLQELRRAFVRTALAYTHWSTPSSCPTKTTISPRDDFATVLMHGGFSLPLPTHGLFLAILKNSASPP